MKLHLGILLFVFMIGCGHFGKKQSESGQSIETNDQARLRSYLAHRPSLGLPINITAGTKSIFTSAILLTIVTAVMFLSWPIFLFVEYFNGEFRPSLIEPGIPLLLSITTIFLVWKSKKTEMNKYLKIALLIPPLMLTLYVGGYFTLRFFF